MSTAIIVRYGEIWLKGKKRSYFERLLCRNISRCLNFYGHPYTGIVRRGGRIIIETPANCLHLARVPGIVSFCFAQKTEAHIDSIQNTISCFFLPCIEEPFRVRVQRIEKHGPSSQEIEQALGTTIIAKTGKRVNLSQPKTTVHIDWHAQDAFVSVKEFSGPGGLPAAHEKSIVLPLRTEKDLLAGRMLLKRGCIPDVVVYNEHLYSVLQACCPGMQVQIVAENAIASYDMVVTGDETFSHPHVYLPLEGML